MLDPRDEICCSSRQAMATRMFPLHHETTSSTLRELPVAGVNLLSAQDARIETGGGDADPGEQKLWTRCAAAITTV